MEEGPLLGVCRRVKDGTPNLCTSNLFSGDLSSISGSEDSDSASEEDLQILDEDKAESEKPGRPQGFHPHRVLFQNARGQFLDAYRCVLGPRQASGSADCVVNCSLWYIQPRFPRDPVHFLLFLSSCCLWVSQLIAQSRTELA